MSACQHPAETDRRQVHDHKSTHPDVLPALHNERTQFTRLMFRKVKRGGDRGILSGLSYCLFQRRYLKFLHFLFREVCIFPVSNQLATLSYS